MPPRCLVLVAIELPSADATKNPFDELEAHGNVNQNSPTHLKAASGGCRELTRRRPRRKPEPPFPKRESPRHRHPLAVCDPSAARPGEYHEEQDGRQNHGGLAQKRMMGWLTKLGFVAMRPTDRFLITIPRPHCQQQPGLAGARRDQGNCKSTRVLSRGGDERTVLAICGEASESAPPLTDRRARIWRHTTSVSCAATGATMSSNRPAASVGTNASADHDPREAPPHVPTVPRAVMRAPERGLPFAFRTVPNTRTALVGTGEQPHTSVGDAQAAKMARPRHNDFTCIGPPRSG